MHILYLSTWFPYPPNNGSRIRAYHLLRALAGRHQVTLVAFRPSSPIDDGRRPDDGLGVLRVHPVAVDPFRYVRLPAVLKFTAPIPLACWPSRLMQQTVENVGNGGPWDAVVAFQSPAAQYALQFPAVPRILDVDTAYSHQAYERYVRERHPLARWRAWLSWKKTHRYETSLFRHFRLCTLVSPLEVPFVEGMMNGANTRIQLAANGVDCESHRPTMAPPAPNSLVFNGALTYDVNYDAMQYFLAEIYPQIQRQQSGTSLTVTGSTAGVNLQGLRLDDSVRLSGYVDDVRPLVTGAWVCIAPLRQGGGTRLKILEAMALGTPVVGTAKAAEGLEVVPGRDLLIADEPAEFAAQVVRLLRDPSLRQRLAANARRLVETRYDWAPIGQRFVDLLEEAASTPALKDPVS